MNRQLEGKVIAVTGAGRGVGKGIALCLAAEGAAVVVNDIGASLQGDGLDDTPAQEVVAEIEAAGGRALACGDSVAEHDGAGRIVAAALDRFGRIDGAIHSAGILRDTIFHKMQPEDFERVLRVHLFGAFNIASACAPHFRAQEAGSLVFMTSTAALIGSVGQANYAAAKMGIVGLSRSISLDMARFGVRSNCIAPHAFFEDDRKRPRPLGGRAGKSAGGRPAPTRSRRSPLSCVPTGRGTSQARSSARAATRSTCTTSRARSARCTARTAGR
ncbi:MAG: SDR family NAD(P)-dependent oxidoreductase [Paracoccaceae bacterium]